MQALFNTNIDVQGRTTGDDDADGNRTYTYSDILTDERCRASIKVVSKLTDDKNWITFKIRRFTIKDIDTDLTDATHVVYDSKYYKIDKVREPEQSFGRAKYRIIEAEWKEGKA